MFFNGKYRIIRKMKYIADQQGIIDRYLKEAESWASHLENTKKAIVEGAEGKIPGTCAVLGSGWLLDVPIQFLSQKFKNVYLFDVIHPTQIKHKINKYHNVELVEQDITGGAINEFFDSVQVYKSMKVRKEPAEFMFKGFSYKMAFDYVVSVNILNQLDILLVDYIKGYNLYSEEEILNFRVNIQKNHFESLPQGKTCLITDYEELVYDKQNNLEATIPLLHISLPEEKIHSKWQWQFDHQDYKPGKNVIFNVVVINI